MTASRLSADESRMEEAALFFLGGKVRIWFGSIKYKLMFSQVASDEEQLLLLLCGYVRALQHERRGSCK